MSINQLFNNNLLEAFISLITEQTGLIIKERDRDDLKKQICNRTQLLNLPSPENYYKLLATTSNTNSLEWQQIIILLTNNESYFFRDTAQIDLLEKQIFPELIQRKQTTKTLRICSAGCSTGEEPYTLAILLKELIPDLVQWNLQIIALDLDREVLKKAAAGVYSSWSFRGVQPRIKQQYFQVKNNQYHLNSDIKEMVKFKNINLVNDSFVQSDWELNNIDLFICRNVFIYFPEDKITTVLNKIYNSLQPLGYLLTGHTELAAQDLSCFKIEVFEESIIYQRPELNNVSNFSSNSIRITQNQLPNLDQISSQQENFSRLINSIEQSQKLLSNPLIQIKPLPIKTNLSFSEIEKLVEQQQYTIAIAELQKLINQPSNQIDYYYLLAKIYADTGKHLDAIAVCESALQIDSLAVSIYYLLAQVKEELGNFIEAKELLKKIIYLDQSFIAAYLNLSQLYQREGDLKKTFKMQIAALNLLKQLPENQKISGMGNLTTQDLISQIKTTI
ncbi:MCP methyltransferase, CheR-type [Stanieria cyanosphaera PCC 7437]|uniref:protein-glutamate O-methyltransferase n=1 Tax=Stanieria cyanosphaera (strain ATCC 29371 / PCC 7437) TaxID=111780 RepID=K9XSH7_STAC7|nr:CheR family methyltransferase [Stanieria cyanosphaera]AFZ34612.1 MCP methyltransferase, CheR-type [Stanieria cyanosphaera PCC 7437]